MLALVGGDEFKHGNEEQDRMLARAAGRGPAFVVPTAAARQGPELAVAHATAWFERFDLELRELPVLKRTDANSKELADLARSGGFFYMVGGDPGLVVQVLQGTRVWTSMFQAWRDGASLAGSSAGAMALCSHTLIRAGWPDHTQRRPVDALGVVPNAAVAPHFEKFGQRWVESARRELHGITILGLDERTAAVWADGEWVAAGPGAATIIKSAKVERFTSGMKVMGLATPARMLPTT